MKSILVIAEDYVIFQNKMKPVIIYIIIFTLPSYNPYKLIFSG